MYTRVRLPLAAAQAIDGSAGRPASATSAATSAPADTGRICAGLLSERWCCCTCRRGMWCGRGTTARKAPFHVPLHHASPPGQDR